MRYCYTNFVFIISFLFLRIHIPPCGCLVELQWLLPLILILFDRFAY